MNAPIGGVSTSEHSVAEIAAMKRSPWPAMLMTACASNTAASVTNKVSSSVAVPRPWRSTRSLRRRNQDGVGSSFALCTTGGLATVEGSETDTSGFDHMRVERACRCVMARPIA